MKSIYNTMNKTIQLLIAFIVAFTVTSCQDDDLIKDSDKYEEGLPVDITLKVSLNKMDVATRTSMNDDYANKINDLWIGVYNSNTGVCTYNKIYTAEEIGQPDNHKPVILPKFTAQTGPSYIVAVANVRSNYGITDNVDLKNTLSLNQGYGTTLGTLLVKADSWEKYKSISHMLQSPYNVDFSENNSLAMSGSYHYEINKDPSSWYDENGNPEIVNITSNVRVWQKWHTR